MIKKKKNNKIYLGIHVGHGAGAALMINGEITHAFQEERFTKIKNFCGYPKKSIDKCINYIQKNNLIIDIAGFSSTTRNFFGLKYPINHFFSIQDYKKYYGEDFYNKILSKQSVKKYIKKLDKDKRNKSNLYFNYNKFKFTNTNFNKKTSKGTFQKNNNYQKKFLLKHSKKLIKKIEFIDHHTCHAHYACYSIPRKEIRKNKYAIITLDSLGDSLNQTLWLTDKDCNLKKININNQCDIARVYKLTTLILSMKPDEHEFKVMGLAPYAKKKYATEVYNEVYKNLLKVVDCKVVYKNRPKNLFKYLTTKLDKYRFDNIAGGLQMFVEKLSSELFRQINSKYKVKHFSISGGVSLNIKMNKILSELNFVKKIYVSPTGSDDSLPMGACYVLSKNNSKPLSTIYLGNELIENKTNLLNSIKSHFKNRKNFKIYENQNQKRVVELLHKGNIIALANHREEFGARALGNRSIVANPKQFDAVKVINEMIKKRDFWMPFALSILEEKHKSYLLNKKNINSEFMTIGFDTKKKMINKIIAGTHPQDLTVRPQILKKERNLNYYNLINDFYKKSKIPALLNTSLNLHGFPISSTLQDVVKTFKNSGLKYLYLNYKYLIKKN